MTKYLSIGLLLLMPIFSVADETADQDKTVVTVNGVAITQQEVVHFMAQKQQPTPPRNAIQEMINVELLVQDARNQGIMQDQQLLMEIKRNESALIASQHLQNILQQLEITEQQLQERYQQEYAEGDKNPEYNASHILVETEQQARAIIEQLDQGAGFSELAKSESIGPSGKNGGALGWFNPGDMVAAFSEAAQKLEPGQYSKQPVQTQFGWHVILLNDTRIAEPPAFESVQQQLRTAIAAEHISKHIESLQDKADIKFQE